MHYKSIMLCDATNLSNLFSPATNESIMMAELVHLGSCGVALSPRNHRPPVRIPGKGFTRCTTLKHGTCFINIILNLFSNYKFPFILICKRWFLSVPPIMVKCANVFTPLNKWFILYEQLYQLKAHEILYDKKIYIKVPTWQVEPKTIIQDVFAWTWSKHLPALVSRGDHLLICFPENPNKHQNYLKVRQELKWKLF